jgi:hypothetical protein
MALSALEAGALAPVERTDYRSSRFDPSDWDAYAPERGIVPEAPVTAEEFGDLEVVIRRTEQSAGSRHEQETASQTEPSERQKTSIFTYFNIDNEVAYARRQFANGVSLEDQVEYLDNNAYRFLEEFAGRVETSKIYYHWKPDGLHAPGVAESAMESWQRWADQTGGKRERADATGFARMEESFRRGEANVAFQVSPPSIGEDGFGNYGFFNVYVNQGDRVALYLLKYDNEDASLSKSNTFMRRLSGGTLPESRDPADFLATPALYQVQHVDRFLQENLARLGFGEHCNPEREGAFTIAMKHQLGTWIEGYRHTLMEMVDEHNPQRYDYLREQAKQKLSACFRKAESLKRNLEKEDPATLKAYLASIEAGTMPGRSRDEDAAEFAYYASMKEATVAGGGTCPAGESSVQSIGEMVADRGGILDYGAATSATSWKEGGKKILKCVCPFCTEERGKPVRVNAVIQNSRITCPSCKKSAPYNC